MNWFSNNAQTFSYIGMLLLEIFPYLVHLVVNYSGLKHLLGLNCGYSQVN